MSYYLYPKANKCIIHIQTQSHSLEKKSISISPSLTKYLYELIDQTRLNPIEYEYIQREMHTYYNGILANGPDDSYYELIEIMYTMRINSYLDYYVAKNIQILKPT